MSERIFTGKEVAEHIEMITPSTSDIPDIWIDKFVLPRKFHMLEVNLEDLIMNKISDTGFMEYYENFEPRYKYSEEDEYYIDADTGDPVDISKEDIYEPVVIVDGIVIDGYSRISTLSQEGAETIYVFIALIL